MPAAGVWLETPSEGLAQSVPRLVKTTSVK